jgi:hypothetical protein
MAVELSVVRDRAPSRGARRAAEGSASATPRIVEPLDGVVARSIDEIDRCEWDSLFAGELECWGYLRALERAALDACEPVYFAIRSGGRLVAAAPAFVGRRALAEPWRGESRGQWRHARQRMLVLGSPLSAAWPIGLPVNATVAEKSRLVDRMLRTAHEEAGRLGFEELSVSGGGAAYGEPRRRFGALAWRAHRRAAETVRLSLPPWSFSDYLSCVDEPLHGALIRVCAQAAPYERDWRIDLDRDLESMLALCREAGLDELNGAFFRNMLGLGVCGSCLVVRVDGELAGFSLLLHDARTLREKLTVVSRRVKGSLVRSLIWLETVRYCLECGVRTFESPSELSRAATRSTR